jgi:hypothetical protein
MRTIPWQPGFTWRKLGFISYSDSLAYREVIEMNPGWDVTVEPPIGAGIYYEPSSPNAGLLGTNTTFSPSSLQAPEDIFPFSSVEEYNKALSSYQIGNVLQVDRLNGWSVDSSQARLGFQ